MTKWISWKDLKLNVYGHICHEIREKRGTKGKREEQMHEQRQEKGRKRKKENMYGSI